MSIQATTPDGEPLDNRRCTCAYYCLNEITAEGFAVAKQKWCDCACHAALYAKIIADADDAADAADAGTSKPKCEGCEDA